ncbi:hypothetical protein DVH05_025642 [Phytophthora capsici]|nr:hypothetical protein DVH05_025642 [Phytophthora capsici]
MQKDLAELSPQQGGVGIPNILTELIAMGASMVLEWGMSVTVQEQTVGTILQGQGYGGHLEECHTNPTPILSSSQWATGKSWAELWMAAKGPSPQHGRASAECIRQRMRVKWGLQLRWTREGLEIRCEGKLRTSMEQIRAKRRKLYGDFIHEARGSIELATIALWNDQGQQRNWKDYSAVIRGAKSKRLRDLCRVTHRQRGVTTFSPCTELRAGVGRQAKQFSELCLNILATYPELACHGKEDAELRVRYGLEDQHHSFELIGEDKRVLQHSWCREVTTKALAKGQFNIQETIATILGVEENSVWVVPHPWISKLRPLWTGKRRWKQRRRDLKRLINRKRDHKAELARARIQQQLSQQHGDLARIIATLDWKHITALEGISPYQMQNLMRLKWNRLRLWAGHDKGYACQRVGCEGKKATGTVHLAWDCQDAQLLWKEWVTYWEHHRDDRLQGAPLDVDDMEHVFSFKLKHLPDWLSIWGEENNIDDWETLEAVASAMWNIGSAVTLTAIWRWQVDRLYGRAGTDLTPQAQVSKLRKQITEALERFRLKFLPVTQSTIRSLTIAEFIMRRLNNPKHHHRVFGEMDRVRIGFFDGGSRGNPGAGGSGSVMVEVEPSHHDFTLRWAAATALGRKDTTNNVAEFIGLNRLLQKAVEQDWIGLHVVGDSALILGMMERRNPPKSKRLLHWYRVNRKLADKCRVTSWSHHYRQHNKMADWLANLAMDSCKSVTWWDSNLEEDTSQESSLLTGVVRWMHNDCEHWRNRTVEEVSGNEDNLSDKNTGSKR